MLHNDSRKAPGVTSSMRHSNDPSSPRRIIREPFREGWPVLLVLLLLLVWVVYRGVLPAFQRPAGDFANYHTSARILLSNQSLERAYWDFTWFQKQIDMTGVQHQLGGFIPHPPPTALVMIPLAGIDPVSAKSIWTALNVLLAIDSTLLLSQTFKLPLAATGILLLSTGGALINNFLFGQLYLLVLFSIVLGLYFEQHGRPLLAGLCFGSLTGVKYVGVAWLFYYAWKRKYRVVMGGSGALVLVALAVVWLDGLQIFMTFFKEVLPRHLTGELHDPYSPRWQSWNSLFRNLFLREETFNPTPVLNLPLVFFAAKNLVLGLIAYISIVVIVKGEGSSKRHTTLLRLGWIPLSLLLVSPGGATYHFLLLTISAVLFTRILLDSQRLAATMVLWLLLLCINLSHHLWLEPLMGGWSTVLVYSRLGLLLLYALLGFFLLVEVRWASLKTRWIAPDSGNHFRSGNLAVLSIPEQGD